MIRRDLGVALALMVLWGCTTTAQGASPGSSGSSGSSGSTPPASGDTCGQVLECASACADTACQDACVEKGSSSAKEKYQAASVCIQFAGCNNDTPCIEGRCKPQLDACRTDVPPKYVDPLAPGSGSVPADFVGTWISQSGNFLYTFKADGTYEETAGAATGGSCDLSTVFSTSGIVAFDTSTVIFSETSSTKKTSSCGAPDNVENLTPVSVQKAYLYESGILYLCDGDGSSKDGCAVQLSKQ